MATSETDQQALSLGAFGAWRAAKPLTLSPAMLQALEPSPVLPGEGFLFLAAHNFSARSAARRFTALNTRGSSSQLNAPTAKPNR